MQGSLFGNEHITDENRKAFIAEHVDHISSHADAIRALRDSCPHNDVDRQHHSDTGNWCPQDNAYWTECKCFVCGKTWTENYKDGYTR